LVNNFQDYTIKNRTDVRILERRVPPEDASERGKQT
jgi:hypothetical protein